MDSERRTQQALSRRDFLRVAGSAAAVGAGVVLLGACGSDDSQGSPASTSGSVVDPPPETTTIRLNRSTSLCLVPLFVADQFLAEEGFTDVQYTESGGVLATRQLASGEIDIGGVFASSLMVSADRDDQLRLLGGMHPTCFELIAGDRVQAQSDLRGKRLAVSARDASADVGYAFMATLLAFIDIDIERDVEIVEVPSFDDQLQQLEAGTIDAMLGTPNISSRTRALKNAHVVLDGILDPPWSRYFCCMTTGNRDFVEQHPAATKRALRAIYKASDLCAAEPERAARYVVDKGYFTQDYDTVRQAVIHMTHATWRDFNPEDTVRFYALRLKEGGFVKSTPDELVSRVTDWSYLDQIKQELAIAGERPALPKEHRHG